MHGALQERPSISRHYREEDGREGGMMKVSELSGAQLDYWVAKAEGFQCSQNHSQALQKNADYGAECQRRTIFS